MRVENRTHWNTAHLRAFVSRTAHEYLDAPQRKELMVRFVSARTRGVSGHAYLGPVWYKGRRTRFVTLRLPTGNQVKSRRGPFIKVYEPEGWHWERTDSAPMTDPSIPKRSVVIHQVPLPNKRAIAAVLRHEYGHTLGRKHSGCHGASTMRGHYDAEELARACYEWAEEMPLERD